MFDEPIYAKYREKAMHELKRVVKARDKNPILLSEGPTIVKRAMEGVFCYKSCLSNEELQQYLAENPGVFHEWGTSELTIGQCITSKLALAIQKDLEASLIRRAFSENEW